MKIAESFELFYLHFAVKIYEWIQQRRVKRLFYADHRYRALDRELLRGLNPYRFEEAFPYGETPLYSLKQIADRCGLKKEDKVFDLGCGRGRGAFFLAHHFGCEVCGVDLIRPFIRQAESLKRTYRVPNASFKCEDIRKTDLSSATFVFYYGSASTVGFVEELTEAFKTLPSGCKIVTVSYPLEGFKVLDQFSVSFPWGIGDVFLNVVK
jgi:SAM-dependent methyltransferase